MDKKVLVCITPQSNSKRLIDKGYEVSIEKKAELHILNITKGDNILSNVTEAILIQQLFTYASQLGATIHGLCGDNVYDIMKKFIKDNMITNIVFGQPSQQNPNFIVDRINLDFPYIDISVLERDGFE